MTSVEKDSSEIDEHSRFVAKTLEEDQVRSPRRSTTISGKNQEVLANLCSIKEKEKYLKIFSPQVKKESNSSQDKAEELKVQARPGIQIDMAASEQSALNFFASDISQQQLSQETPRSVYQYLKQCQKGISQLMVPPASESESGGSPFVIKPQTAPLSNQTNMSRAFEDSPKNEGEQPSNLGGSGQACETEMDEFCGIKFDVGSQPQIPEALLEKAGENETMKATPSPEEAEQATRFHPLQRPFPQLESSLVSLAIAASVLGGEHQQGEGRDSMIILERILAVVQLSIQLGKITAEFYGTASNVVNFLKILNSRSALPLLQAAALFLDVRRVQSTISILFIAYLGVISSEISAAKPTEHLQILSLVGIWGAITVLYAQEEPSVPAPTPSLSSASFLSTLMILAAIWLAFFNKTVSARSDISKLNQVISKLQASSSGMAKLQEELRTSRSNTHHLFNSSGEALLICEIESGKSRHHKLEQTKIKRVLAMNFGFQQLFLNNSDTPPSLPATFMKKQLQEVDATKDISPMYSLQSAITRAYSGVNSIFTLAMSQQEAAKESDEAGAPPPRGYFEIEVVPTVYNNSATHLVKIRNISGIIWQQNKKMQDIFQEALIATISHEQLNPLNSIINMSTFLFETYLDKVKILQTHKSEFQDESALQESGLLDELEEATQTMQWSKMIRSSSITMQILNAAILNQGLVKSMKYVAAFEILTEPQLVVKKLLSLFEDQINSRELTLDFQQALRGPSSLIEAISTRGLFVDIALYEQILFNILANAFKFNKQRGTITIRFNVKPATDSQVVLSTTIEDTGQGMTKRKRLKLGKVFESIRIRESSGEDKTAAQSATSGVGLGLSLSHDLAKFLNGSIEIDSEPQKGTTVRADVMFTLATTPLRHRSPEIQSKKQSNTYQSVEVMKEEVQRTDPRMKETPKSRLSSIALSFSNRRIAAKKISSASNRRKHSNLEASLQKRLGLNRAKAAFSFIKASPLPDISSKSVSDCGSDSSTPESELNRLPRKAETRPLFSLTSQNLIGEQDALSLEQYTPASLTQRQKQQADQAYAQQQQQQQTEKISFGPELRKGLSFAETVSAPSDDVEIEGEDLSLISDPMSPHCMIQTSLQQQLDLFRVKTKSSLMGKITRRSSQSPPRMKQKIEQTSNIAISKTVNCFDEEGGFSAFLRDNDLLMPGEAASNSEDEEGSMSARSSSSPEKKEEPREDNEPSASFNATSVNASLPPVYPVQRKSFYVNMSSLQQIQEDFEEDKGSNFSKGCGRQQVVNLPASNSSGKGTHTGKIGTPEPRLNLLNLSQMSNQQSFEVAKIDLSRVDQSLSPISGHFKKCKVMTPDHSGKRVKTRLMNAASSASSSTPVKPFRAGSVTGRALSSCGDLFGQNHCTSPIMIVDDSQFNVATLEMIISKKVKPKCRTACNGEEAVELFKELNSSATTVLDGKCKQCQSWQCEFKGVELIFMDLNMPVMDGFEASEKIFEMIKTKRSIKPCTIVALTAYKDQRTRERCLSLGMDRVLNKPANAEKIGDIILEFCPSISR